MILVTPPLGRSTAAAQHPLVLASGGRPGPLGQGLMTIWTETVLNCWHPRCGDAPRNCPFTGHHLCLANSSGFDLIGLFPNLVKHLGSCLPCFVCLDSRWICGLILDVKIIIRTTHLDVFSDPFLPILNNRWLGLKGES